MRSNLTVPVLALVAFFLSGCSDISDGLSILQGNYAFQRGDYQKASLHYLQVQQVDRFGPWVDYDLGNVYNALGEANSALSVWNSVDEKSPDELLFCLWFNKGDLLYQKGLYQEAYLDFQKALLLRPSSLDAKRNLELSLLKIQSFGSSGADRPAVPQDSRPPSPTPEARALLDYIQRLEGNRWKSNNKNEPTPSSSDW